jgi:hypothetical protein
MRAFNILNEEVINIIEVESLTSFIPETGELVNLPDNIGIGYYNYDGVWKIKREYLEPEIIAQRNQLLVESDIAMLPDNYSKLSEEKKTEWASYRQALRDLPTQEGFPWEITWPLKPVKA